MQIATAIDFGGVAERANLREVIRAELGPPDRLGKWLCPFHDDRNPSMGLTPDGRRFKCFSCGAAGDAIDWHKRRAGLTIAEAARKLDPSIPEAKGGRKQTARPAPPPAVRLAPATKGAGEKHPWHDPAWQAAVETIVRQAEARLWLSGDPEAREALAWLRGRGLADHTISRFRLGFLPDRLITEPLSCLPPRNGKPRGIVAQRGITIPWVAPESWYSPLPCPDVEEPARRWVGCNVRRLMPEIAAPWSGADKCRALDGSTRGYAYPWPDLTPGVSCLVVEGEMDSLIATQEIGHLVNVATVGGARQTPRPEAIEAMRSAPLWLIATDHDQAGDADAEKWRRLDPRKARRLYLPHGKDIGEYRQAGGDLGGWLKSEYRRLGLR